jgi:cytoskeletal protein CcmA (bactofilin family)
MRRIPVYTLMIVLVFAVLLPGTVAAEENPSRVQIGRDIIVQAGEKNSDVVCIACSIRIHGQTAGDVVAVAGSITLEQGAQVAGDTVAVVGDIRLQAGAQIAGSVTTVAGAVRRDPQATIASDVTSLEGSAWMLLILLVPLMMVGGVIALIIWLVQRSRRPVPVAALPGGVAGMR